MAGNGLYRYFDLRSEGDRRLRDINERETGSVAPQYAALLVGVLFQPFFDAFQQSQAWDFRWQWVLFALIVTFAIFPAVYRRAWDPDKPMFVQLCTIFSAGLGWQSLLAIGAKSVT